MKRINIIFLITFILAFCSIVYELLFAQLLSAFLGNSVLRYSTTIGLYMFSMGIGAWAAGIQSKKTPALNLLKVEVLLTVIGGFSVVILFWLFIFLANFQLGFVFLVHGLIVLVGILTGFEIPLLIDINNKQSPGENSFILGIDYLGAFTGTVIFAFIFYPQAGLMSTAFFAGWLNSLAGALLFTQRREIIQNQRRIYFFLLSIQILLFVIMFICLINAFKIDDYFIVKYLAI